ncbi:hypothetical protein L1049_008238 [Liquidambar formosana]|uniref:Uncharacterized protein n=1 Tax=Liquidambar formosana TaxID=63359 RepID=A0AAP0SAG9_LIQFO
MYFPNLCGRSSKWMRELTMGIQPGIFGNLRREFNLCRFGFGMLFLTTAIFGNLRWISVSLQMDKGQQGKKFEMWVVELLHALGRSLGFGLVSILQLQGLQQPAATLLYLGIENCSGLAILVEGLADARITTKTTISEGMQCLTARSQFFAWRCSHRYDKYGAKGKI